MSTLSDLATQAALMSRAVQFALGGTLCLGPERAALLDLSKEAAEKAHNLARRLDALDTEEDKDEAEQGSSGRTGAGTVAEASPTLKPLVPAPSAPAPVVIPPFPYFPATRPRPPLTPRHGAPSP